jgi:hypothetical protein
LLETIEVCPLLNSPTGLLLHALQTQHMGACAPYPVGILERGKSDDQLSGCCVAQQLRASHLDSPLKFTRITDDEACISIHLSKPHIFHGGSSKRTKSHDIASHTSVPSPLPWISNSSPSSNEPSGVPQFSSTQSFSQKLSILPTQRALPPSLLSQPQWRGRFNHMILTLHRLLISSDSRLVGH